jgi:hypothetical protein
MRNPLKKRHSEASLYRSTACIRLFKKEILRIHGIGKSVSQQQLQNEAKKLFEPVSDKVQWITVLIIIAIFVVISVVYLYDIYYDLFYALYLTAVPARSSDDLVFGGNRRA